MSLSEEEKEKFENWMSRTYPEPEWDEGWTRHDLEEAFKAGILTKKEKE